MIYDHRRPDLTALSGSCGASARVMTLAPKAITGLTKPCPYARLMARAPAGKARTGVDPVPPQVAVKAHVRRESGAFRTGRE